jgi:PAS domain S-box-containing protein
VNDLPTIGLLLAPEDEGSARALLSGSGLALRTLTPAEAASLVQPNGCLLISHRPGLIDGVRTLEAIRAPDGRLPAACILLGDGAEMSVAVSAMRAGAMDFLPTAGLTPDALRSAIRAAVETFEAKSGSDRLFQELAHLAAIVGSSTDAVVSLESDGTTVRTWSPGAVQLFGYTADEAVGRTVDALIIPSSKSEERLRIYNAISSQREALIIDTERRHKDGDLIPVEINVSPIVVSDTVIGYSVVFRDIRRRREAEEAVREAHDKLARREGELARAQRIAGIGSYEVERRDGRFVGRRSPEYMRIHGLVAAESNESHDDWLARIHPEDRTRAEQSFHAALASGTPEYETEYRIIRRTDGAVRWIKVLAEIEGSESGAPARLFGTHIDITEQRLAAEAFRANEVRLRLAIEAARLGLFEIDWERRERHWSPELRALLAVPEALDISSDLDLMGKLVPENQLERYKSKMRASFDPENAEYEDEHEVVCFDGTRRHVLLRARTVFADTREGPMPIRTIGFMMDITQHKLAEQQRDLLLRELDHRIKNIFSTVSSIISLSAHTAENVQDFSESLRDRLFALSAVHDLVRNIDHTGAMSLAELAATVTSRGLSDKITAEGPDISVSVQVATAFGMILNELLTNALKYGALTSPDGGVSLRWTTKGDDFVMEWTESGGPAVASGRRVGFGTKMIERVVATLGGQADVSRPPSGLCVRVTCPLARIG